MRVFLRCLILLISVLLITSSATLRSQTRYYDNWFFGDSVGINFSSGTPRVQRGSIHTFEGSDAISDPATGELLFYTDGSTVWNRSHEIMSGGTGLKGGGSSSQAALIVPSPGNPSHYYIFTTDEGEYINPPNDGVHYSLVDMEREGGLGEVITRNVELLPNASEKLVGVRHCNRRDIWVIAYREWETEYHAWLVTPEGVSDPTITKIPHTSPSSHGSIGSLKASPDGRYLFSIDVGFPSVGRLLAFNNRTGEIVRSIAYLPAEYSASFSRNSDYLYTSVRGENGSAIMQYPVTSDDSATIVSGLREIGGSFGSSSRIGTFQLAPDGNIYVTVVTAPLRIGVIENADADDARFRDSAIFPGSGSFVEYSYGLANSIDGYLTTRFAPPLLEREVDTSICIGQSLRLLPSEGSRYRWDSLPDNDCLDCRDPIVSPRESGTYGVTIWTEGSCAYRETFRVEVIPLPDITITGDTAVCPGSTLRLQASGGVRYRWDDAPGLNCTDCPDPEASIAGARTYHVTVWNEAGCEARDSVRVSLLPRPTADAGADTAICVGSSVRLRGSGGERFLWRRADGNPLLNLSCSDCSDPVASPSETTTYVLTVTSAVGCSDSDSVRVEVRTESTFSIVGDTVICPATPARIAATGAERFRWDFSPDLSCLDCPDPIASPSQTTTYYVTGMASDGSCPARDSITIRVLDRPQVRAGSDTAICAGSSLMLGAEGGAWYRWDFSPGLSCLDCPDPTASPTQTTTFYVTGFSAEGCDARDSITITVIPPPVVDAGRDRVICAGNSAQLSAAGGTRWAWEPSDGLDCVDCPNPTASPETTTTYRLTAWGVEGCSAFDSVTVVVEPARELLLQIDRDHIGFNGEPLVIPILLQESLDSSDISRITLELEYDPDIMLLDRTSVERLLGGTMLEGWDVLVVGHRYGVIELELHAPVGETLSGVGEFLRFEARMFLGSTRGTELPFRVRATTNCFDFSAVPGYITMDSLCGMNFRVIEVSGAKYRSPTVYPNPATDGQIAFDFGIGLEGETRLEIFDQRGNRVARLIDQILTPGMYRIEWDVRGAAAGMYHYRLTSSAWSQTGAVRIE